MNSNNTIRRAVITVLGSAAAAGYAPHTLAADTAATSGGLEEVIVTAERRSENLQNVPITVTALTSDTLKQLNVTTAADYFKFIPSLTNADQGPGSSQIYIRGLATTQDGEQSQGATGSFPNVAVYLDEQSAQIPGRNLDVYAADLERIEVLEGPQGTLFGAGAQAGVVRYITNKPKLDKTEAVVNAGYGTTWHGDPSSNFDFTLNLPVIDGKAALRAVMYNETRGGYINNVPGTITRKNTDLGIAYYFNGQVPAINPTASNSLLAQDHFNSVTYKGFRLTGLYQFDEDWKLTLAQSYQDMEADGIFSVQTTDPDGKPLPELSTTQFTAPHDKDRFTNTAWTLDGRIGALKMVYTGGYLVRKVDQVADYTNYVRGAYGDYYTCILPNTPQAVGLGVPNGECLSPVANFRVNERNTHQNHEFRLSTPDDWRVRAIGGLFYEDFLVQNITDWYYRAPDAGFVPLIAPAASSSNYKGIRDPLSGFYDDIQRGYKQKAAFASVDVDIIPKKLTFTVGTRYYNMDTFEVGSKGGSYGCRPGGKYSGLTVVSPCDSGLNLDTIPVPAGNAQYSDTSIGLHKTYKGFKSRANLTWKFSDVGLVYGTWSQGFRPGGFNRSSGFVSAGQSPLKGIFLTPIGFKPDILTNKEIGFKTQWMDRHLQVNGTVYQEDWKDVQIGLFDPGVLGNLTFTANGPDYRVDGFELNVDARLPGRVSISYSGAWNRSKLTNRPALNDNTGKPINFEALGLHNPYGAVGSPLSMSPPVQGNVRLRKDFDLGAYGAFVQGAALWRGHEYSTTDMLSQKNDLAHTPARYDIQGYQSYDLSFGLSRNDWEAQLYVSNLTDKRGITFATYAQRIDQYYVTRPRTIMLKVNYKFHGQ
ncbi:MAG: TonB-dependent receptor [Gammaproteobacteria bacterium]|nr:TonB-dependent receptor [Gammaproteobacteria bacterium]MDE2251322.1 TonB-dependent receptor [Gammaproteobacteria bacterium]